MRYLSLLVAILLSSCTLPWSTDNTAPHSFSTDYARVVHTIIPNIHSGGMIDAIDQWYTTLYPAGYGTSVFHFFYSIPETGSGDLTLGADAVRESWKRVSSKLSLTGAIETPEDTLVFNDVRGEVVSIFPAKTYAKIDALSLSGTIRDIDAMIEKVRPYIGKWILSDSFSTTSQSLQPSDEGQDALTQFFTRLYLNGANEIFTHGFDAFEKLLVTHPLLSASSETGTLVGEHYEYPVTITGSGVQSLINALLDQYAGSGAIPEAITTSIAETTRTISGSGIFRVHQTNADNYGFSGVLQMNKKSYTIVMDVRPEKVIYEIMGMSGGMISTLDRLENGKTKYVLQMHEGKKVIEVIRYEGTIRKGYEDFTLTIHSDEKTESGSIDIAYQNDGGSFSGSIHTSGYTESIDANVVGMTQEGRLQNLSGSMIGSDERLVNVRFGITPDATFSGSIQVDNIEIHTTGHIRKQDILVQLESQGMTATLTHQMSADGSWSGKFIFPVGNMDWSGRTKNKILESAHMHLNSPFSTMRVDLEKSGTGVTGPFQITRGGSEILSGSISMVSMPKIGSIRIDTTLPGMTPPSYVGFSSFMDLRGDTNARVQEPADAMPIMDIVSQFSSSRTSIPASSTTSVNSYSTRSSDATRIAHLKEIATSLEAYSMDNGQYPDMIPSGCVTFGVHGSSYMPHGIPVDPEDGVTPGCTGSGGMTYAYRVLTDATGSQHFVLSAQLRNETGGNSARPLTEYDASEYLSPSGPSLIQGSGKYYILYK